MITEYEFIFYRRVELLGAIAEMVMSVCRQHSNTITRSPAPVITALINILITLLNYIMCTAILISVFIGGCYS